MIFLLLSILSGLAESISLAIVIPFIGVVSGQINVEKFFSNLPAFSDYSSLTINEIFVILDR